MIIDTSALFVTRTRLIVDRARTEEDHNYDM